MHKKVNIVDKTDFVYCNIAKREEIKGKTPVVLSAPVTCITRGCAIAWPDILPIPCLIFPGICNCLDNICR